MATVRIAINLPGYLNLPNGEYAVGAGEKLFLKRIFNLTTGDMEPRAKPAVSQTAVLSKFDASEEIDSESASRIAASEAGKLIRQANRLLRWYRQLASLPGMLEVTRAQVSPFEFTVLAGDSLPGVSVRQWVLPSLAFEAEEIVPARFGTSDALAASLREKLASTIEPDVADLNLLDAQHAKNIGRFREAVLLSWSVIDSSFIRKFESLVDQKLAGEWREARKFLKGHDFGLRHKMTTGLRLVAARSFFDEPNGLWNKLSESYEKRNAIIHKGAGADEDDAAKAVAVARKVLDIIDAL
jgi:hypothetical protein